MVNVATGAAKENRTVDSVVVPNSDVTLDQITQSGALFPLPCQEIQGRQLLSGMFSSMSEPFRL
jgi:hypothetical protein